MSSFRFNRERIDEGALRAGLADPSCGGYASFEGLVRNHNEGLQVRHLEYEAFEPLAVKEGERIIAEAIARFGVEHASCVHRIGDLAIGDMAVWVGVSSRHRNEAFLACRYIIDEVKHRVPIWKKEHYENGDSGWVNCERCAAPAEHEHHTHHGSHAHAVKPIPDYSRQMALKEVGAVGQAKLRASRVLVVGCGGLGVPVISYLAGAGVGRLGLVDADRLESSNLHRQTLYALADVGKPKAELAALRVRALNPDVDAQIYPIRVDAQNAPELVAQYDLVIDCTDNFSTKFMLNDVCVRLGRAVIFSSVYQYEGQLQVVRPERGSACLRCLWPEATRDGIVGNCSEAGVLGPVPGVFGTLQALEALKILLNLPGQLGDEMLVVDLLTMATTRLHTKKAATCPEHALSRPDVKKGLTVEDKAEFEFETLGDAIREGFQIVDIREPEEVEETPLPAPQAQHIPMGELLQGETFKPSGKCLLVCASGKRSLAATLELRSRGLSLIYSLKGGLKALLERST